MRAPLLSLSVRFLFVMCLASSCGSGQIGETVGVDGRAGDAEKDSRRGPLDTSPEVTDSKPGQDTDIPETDPCAPPHAEAWCPCEDNGDCVSGKCLFHLGDMTCTVPCETACPGGWACKSDGAVDPKSFCFSLYPSLCLPCDGTPDCQGTDKCFEHGDEAGAFCSPTCDAGHPCPDGYSCEEMSTREGLLLRACRPQGGDCVCTDYAIFSCLGTSCRNHNEWGTCTGWRECGEEGLSGCDALVPAAEVCDDEVDNDCDGETDPPHLCPVCHCGDGDCQWECGEDVAGEDFCPADCCICGDGNCQTTLCNEDWIEGLKTCALDCAICSDGVCDPGEGPKSCPEDCCGTCGDGVCKCEETASEGEDGYCPDDCGQYACGNDICEPGENPVDCLEDCEPYACGNGLCEPGENPVLCPDDCGAACGDCVCDAVESYSTCAKDCGFCGDGYCMQDCGYNAETPGTCAADCGCDCDDEDPCTHNLCLLDGSCLFLAKDDGAACDASGICVGSCVDGVCTDVAVELCNGYDDDCDGEKDEDLGITTCGLGLCEHTVENCVAGEPVACDPFEGQGVEICNGLDDDCDGYEDEGCEGWKADGEECLDGAECSGGFCDPDPELVSRCHSTESSCVQGASGAETPDGASFCLSEVAFQPCASAEWGDAGSCFGCQSCDAGGTESCEDDDALCVDSGWDGCASACVRTKSNSGVCTGGLCGTELAYVNTPGLVCMNGAESSPSVDGYCAFNMDCVAGACAASWWALGCDGLSYTCTEAGKLPLPDWVAGAGYVIDETAYTTNTTCLVSEGSCEVSEHCGTEGSFRYEGYTCSDAGICDQDWNPIGCCGDAGCEAGQYCDDGDDVTPVFLCESPMVLSRGVETGSIQPQTETDVGWTVDLATAVDACLRYDAFGVEEATQFDILLNGDKVADGAATGADVWGLHNVIDLGGAALVGDNLLVFDADICCHEYDNVLVGWNRPELGAVDLSVSVGCCAAPTDCVDDYAYNVSHGCYGAGVLRDTGGGDGPDLEECRDGIWYGQDEDETACVNAGNVWYGMVLGETGGSCCGDDGAADNFYGASNDPATAMSLGCGPCSAGVDAATVLYGNGYTEGTTCYHGDITCDENTAEHGATCQMRGEGGVCVPDAPEPCGIPGLWTGAAGTNWNDPANWDDGVVPDQSVDVVLEGGAAAYPSLPYPLTVGGAGSYACASLTIGDGASLWVEQGTTLSISGLVYIDGGSFGLNKNIHLLVFSGGKLQIDAGEVNIGSHTADSSNSIFIYGGAEVEVNGGALRLDDRLAVEGGVLDLNGGEVAVNWTGANGMTPSLTTNGGTFSMEEDALLRIRGCYESSTNYPGLNGDGGAWDLSGGTIRLETGELVQRDCYHLFGGQTLHNLEIDTGDDAAVLDPGASVTVAGDLTIVSGSFEANGQDIHLMGDWTNDGAFLAVGGEVLFEGGGTSAISGASDTTFFDLICVTPGKQITHEAGSSTTILGTYEMHGASANPMVLRSTSQGEPWYLNVEGAAIVARVDVQDSDASGGIAIDATDNCTSAGGNVNWIFACEPECDPVLEDCDETLGVCVAKMVEIPAGNFWMGCNNCGGSTVNDADCAGQEHPYHEVYLDAYEIDKTEVTAAQYMACVVGGGCTGPASGSYATYEVAGKENHPINNVTWYQVESYCLWVGKKMCTEAQWEKGARGDSQQNGGTSNSKAQSRKYPWGNDAPTCGLAVKYGCEGDTQPVCSLSPAGDSPFGLCDMAGNAWEWVADWFGSDYYCAGSGATTSYPWAECPECGLWPGSPEAWKNPYFNVAGSVRVLRGGSFGGGGDLRVSDRTGFDPSGSDDNRGGRCCRSDCGDGFCDEAGGESCSNCIQDCGCPDGDVCSEAVCCTPNCVDKVCGDDGCGGSCGECEDGDYCDAGLCQPLCGNGLCNDLVEDCVTCPVDCGCDPELEECSEVTTGGWTCAAKMVSISAGNFWMGCNETLDPYCSCPETNNQCDYHEVTTGMYWIGLTTVTNAQYVSFLNDHGNLCDGNECVDAGSAFLEITENEGGWSVTGARDDYPMGEVSWFGAKEYCEWLCPSCRLCSEAEWEKAARGGCEFYDDCAAESRIWPWGNEVPGECDGLTAAYKDCNCSGGTCEVGTHPNGMSLYQLHDMSGNVWEWVEDWYYSTYQGAPVDGSAWVDGPSSWARLSRGGTTGDSGAALTVAFRNYDDPTTTYPGLGLRCCGSCVPSCQDKECGDDGCGGSCGECGGSDYCDAGLCKPLCGNGLCIDAGEDCNTCPSDCGCGPSLEECVAVTTGGFECAAKMVEVAAGNFWMGCNNCAGSTVNDTDCYSDEHPYHEVYLDTYEMDRTEVTAAQYGACVFAGGCSAAGTGSNATYQVQGKESHPINYVTWFQMESYCLWAGKELCTEAQWEKGARGGCEHNGGASSCKAESRKYPWGNDAPTCDLAVKSGCGGGIQPVCSKSPAGDSPYGLCDVAGNEWEWTADLYQEDYYCDGDGATGDESCSICGPWPGFPAAWINPYSTVDASQRVLRGGCFDFSDEYHRVSFRYVNLPSETDYDFSGRCCRSE